MCKNRLEFSNIIFKFCKTFSFTERYHSNSWVLGHVLLDVFCPYCLHLFAKRHFSLCFQLSDIPALTASSKTVCVVDKFMSTVFLVAEKDDHRYNHSLEGMNLNAKFVYQLCMHV